LKFEWETNFPDALHLRYYRFRLPLGRPASAQGQDGPTTLAASIVCRDISSKVIIDAASKELGKASHGAYQHGQQEIGPLAVVAVA
jgi:hypothetical protein